MILTEDQKCELKHKLADLDDNSICFGLIFADLDDIMEVIEKFLEDK